MKVTSTNELGLLMAKAMKDSQIEANALYPGLVGLQMWTCKKLGYAAKVLSMIKRKEYLDVLIDAYVYDHEDDDAFNLFLKFGEDKWTLLLWYKGGEKVLMLPFSAESEEDPVLRIARVDLVELAESDKLYYGFAKQLVDREMKKYMLYIYGAVAVCAYNDLPSYCGIKNCKGSHRVGHYMNWMQFLLEKVSDTYKGDLLYFVENGTVYQRAVSQVNKYRGDQFGKWIDSDKVEWLNSKVTGNAVGGNTPHAD